MDSNLSYYVELAMQGDQSALEEIYKQTYWTVYYTCFSFLKNEQDAADTTQEVYMTVMNSLSTLQDKDKFLYWLNRIAVNKCKNILAQNNPVTVDMDVAENVILEENENFLPEDYITNQEKRQLVMNIIRTCLNETQYQTVFLHYFNGFSVSEIAEIMECPVGTVTYRLSVARGKIKQAVTQYENINNEKLYSVGAIPLLACLFSEEFRSLYHVSPTPANIFNSVSTNTLAKAVAKKGADGMLKTAKAKIIASAAGIIVVGGIAAAIITGTRNKEKNPTTAVNITTEGAFTTEAGAEPSDTTTMTDDTSAEENTEAAATPAADARNLDIKLEVVGEFSEGLAAVKENLHGNWGFIDEQGNLVIDFQYDSVYDFREGLACVQNENGLWGYIDKTGNVVIPRIYDHVTYFSPEGVALVVEGSTGYLIDKTGNVLLETDYESSGECSEGLINVKKDEKWGYIDTQGNLVIDCQYDVCGHFSEGLAWVSNGDNSGYIDQQGNVVIDFTFDSSYPSHSEFKNGYAVVQKDGKLGMIDKQGNTVIDFIYEYLGSCSDDGLIYARKDGAYGYIDINGNTVLDFQYDDADEFYDGLAYVSKDGKYGFIDTAGNVVIDFLYDQNYTPIEYRFIDGITPMILDGQGCYIDMNGNVVIGHVE